MDRAWFGRLGRDVLMYSRAGIAACVFTFAFATTGCPQFLSDWSGGAGASGSQTSGATSVGSGSATGSGSGASGGSGASAGAGGSGSGSGQTAGSGTSGNSGEAGPSGGGCDLADPSAYCDGGQGCFWNGDSGFCGPSGIGEQDASCDASANCAPGFGCSNPATNGFCEQWCKLDAGSCPLNMSCQSFAPPVVSNGQEYGGCY